MKLPCIFFRLVGVIGLFGIFSPAMHGSNQPPSSLIKEWVEAKPEKTLTGVYSNRCSAASEAATSYAGLLAILLRRSDTYPMPTTYVVLKSLFAGGALAVLLLSGCASVPNIEADRTAAAQIKRIAVLGIHEPRNVTVMNIGGAAGAFGLIGGLIQGGTNAEHSKQFVEALRQRKVSLSEPMLAAVTQSLKEDGFEVTIATDQKPKVAADGKSDDYSDVHVNADAILSVWFGVVGYMSSPYSTHYEPWVLVKARLLDAKTKKDIYFKTFCVGYKMKIENVVPLPADQKYRYGSFDDLMANIGDAAAGLVGCGEIVAKRIGSDLKRR